MFVAGSVGALALGVVLTATSGSPVWMVVAVASIITDITIVAIARRRLDPDRVGEPTGRVLSPPAPAPPGVGMVGGSHWVGGANVPGSLGRTYATYPMAVLEIDGGHVVLRLRPALLSGFFGSEALQLAATRDAAAFPVRGRRGAKGIGLKPPEQPIHYFWTGQRHAILEALARTGMNTSWRNGGTCTS
jgi:hypothetical protein